MAASPAAGMGRANGMDASSAGLRSSCSRSDQPPPVGNVTNHQAQPRPILSAIVLAPLRGSPLLDPRGISAPSPRRLLEQPGPLAAPPGPGPQAHTATPRRGRPLAPPLAPPLCVCGVCVCVWRSHRSDCVCLIYRAEEALSAALLPFLGSPA